MNSQARTDSVLWAASTCRAFVFEEMERIAKIHNMPVKLNGSYSNKYEFNRNRDQAVRSFRHLYLIAQSSSSQARFAAEFLFWIYDWTRFPFDFTNFNDVDSELFAHCLATLQLTEEEVHPYFKAVVLWHVLAVRWGIPQFSDATSSS